MITTKQPQANMLYNVNQIPIVPQHIWASEVSGLNNFKNQTTPVVGYGPWQLTGYVTNQYATLTANNGFFLGAPKFHTLIVQYFSNSDAMVSALRSGELDVVEYGLTAPQFNSLKHVKGVTVYPQVSSAWTAIELNPGAKTRSGRAFGNGNPALQDPRVRDAIELALNKQELVSKVWEGLAVAGSGYLPPAYPQFVWKPPATQALSYDPAKANQVLTAAGYKMGPNGIRIDPKTHKPLNLRLGIHSDEAADAAMAPYIVEWLKAIGIGVTVDSMSFNQLNDDLPKGDWDMLSDGWSTGPDPSYLLSIQTCADLPLNNGTAGNTDAFFCNPAFDKLYAQQATEFNSGAAGANDRPDAADPVSERGRRHPLLPGLPQRGAHRQGQELLLRHAECAGLLPDAEPVHQPAGGNAGRERVVLIVECDHLDRHRDHRGGIARRSPDPAASPPDRGRAGVAGLEQYLRTALGPEPERAGGPAIWRGLRGARLRPLPRPQGSRGHPQLRDAAGARVHYLQPDAV